MKNNKKEEEEHKGNIDIDTNIDDQLTNNNFKVPRRTMKCFTKKSLLGRKKKHNRAKKHYISQ